MTKTPQLYDHTFYVLVGTNDLWYWNLFFNVQLSTSASNNRHLVMFPASQSPLCRCVVFVAAHQTARTDASGNVHRRARV